MSEDEINKVRDYMQENFFNKLNSTMSWVSQDIELVELGMSVAKVCDFGCGSGFTTLGLMSVLNPSKAIGIDNDERAISQANSWLIAVRKYVQLTDRAEASDTELMEKVYRVLGIQRFPEFMGGDVVTGKNLPNDIDLAYCRRLLVNIYNENGKKGLMRAIEKITECIKPGGGFIAVEESYFGSLLDLIDLQWVSVETPSYNGNVVPHIRCFYRKIR